VFLRVLVGGDYFLLDFVEVFLLLVLISHLVFLDALFNDILYTHFLFVLISQIFLLHEHFLENFNFWIGLDIHGYDVVHQEELPFIPEKPHVLGLRNGEGQVEVGHAYVVLLQEEVQVCDDGVEVLGSLDFVAELHDAVLVDQSDQVLTLEVYRVFVESVQDEHH